MRLSKKDKKGKTASGLDWQQLKFQDLDLAQEALRSPYKSGPSRFGGPRQAPFGFSGSRDASSWPVAVPAFSGLAPDICSPGFPRSPDAVFLPDRSGTNNGLVDYVIAPLTAHVTPATHSHANHRSPRENKKRLGVRPDSCLPLPPNAPLARFSFATPPPLSTILFFWYQGLCTSCNPTPCRDAPSCLRAPSG